MADEKKMTNVELAEAAMKLTAAGQAIATVDLDRLAVHLNQVIEEGQEINPDIYRASAAHLEHMIRLVEACRAVQEVMAYAPGRKLGGGRTNTVVA